MTPIAARSRLRWIGIGLTALLAIASTAQPQEEFESADPTWKVGENDCQLLVVAHRRTFDEAHSGHGSEYLQYRAAKGGSKALFSHAVRPARIIDELSPSVWLKSPQIGIRFSVRVVLPRSRDPSTGRHLTCLLEGDIYEAPGTWAQLTVEDLPLLLKRRTGHLRLKYGPTVDSREAYIDAVVLNGYCGAGITELWLDDLEVIGFGAHLVAAPGTSTPVGVVGASPRVRAAEVRVEGPNVVIDKKPFFARVVDWSGEPFDFLSEMGFNVVRLRDSPTTNQIQEAARHDLWFVAPPPVDQRSLKIAAGATRTLCWQIGSNLTAEDVLPAAARIGELRREAGPAHPAILCDVDRPVSPFAEQTDILQLKKSPIGTSFELKDCAQWWRQVGGTVRPITPFWAAIQTELSAAQQRQVVGLVAADSVFERDVEPEQIWLQVIHAISGGARGIAFQSGSRLDSQDRASRRRAAAIRVVNNYLKILDPWCAAGRVGKSIRLPRGGYFATSLELKLTRLLIVCRSVADQQYLVGPGSVGGPITVPLPNRHIADQAWLISGGGPRPLPAATGAGGSFSLDQPGLFSFIVFSNDELVFEHLGQKSDAARDLIVQNAAEIGSIQLQETEDVLRKLATFGQAKQDDFSRLETVKSAIEATRQMTHSRDPISAMRYLEDAQDQLRTIRRDYWQMTALAFPSPISSPLCTSFRTLGDHWELAPRMRQVRWGPNVMAAGRFEQLDHLLGTNWTQSDGSTSDIKSRVELSLESPRSGRLALKLQSWATSSQSVPERWPVWMNSSSIKVHTGQLIRIEGWVRIDDPITGSSDGLMIFDTMTGTELATRFHSTRGWRHFLLYRVAPNSGELSVVIALTGIGAASIDDLEVYVGSHPETRHAAREFR